MLCMEVKEISPTVITDDTKLKKKKVCNTRDCNIPITRGALSKL